MERALSDCYTCWGIRLFCVVGQFEQGSVRIQCRSFGLRRYGLEGFECFGCSLEVRRERPFLSRMLSLIPRYF